MNKIFRFFTATLLALLLGIAPSFSVAAKVGNQEAENLEAWAKMYEDMNQASGGEIETLMKEMEQSGELDALMKELEESGELDMIIDAMLKSSPDEFMQQLEQEIEKEKKVQQKPVQRPEPIRQAQQPLVSKPKKPTPVMQVDKTKLKQIQAMLSNIVSKIAAIKQKAATRRAIQDHLSPWEFHLTDLSYYLTTIQDDALAKYLQQPEFENLYNHLVALNTALSQEEPRVQVEEILEVEFEDPYITLGFATSNIPKAEVDKKYQQLVKEKNPYAIQDKLKEEGLAPEHITKRFKQAQQEYNKIFEAYKRIEQKETSARAFLSILQSLHKAIYTDKIIDEVKTLLRTYDPEALKLKEAQEQKEKEARAYKKKLAEQYPDFKLDFRWPKLDRGRAIGRKRPPFPGFKPPTRPGVPRSPGQKGKAPSGKTDDKKDKKDGKGKKSDKPTTAKKPDTKSKDKKKDEKKKKEKPKGTALAKKAAPTIRQVQAALEQAVPTVEILSTPQAITDNAKQQLAQVTKSLNAATKLMNKQVKSLKDAKDKEELKKYYAEMKKNSAPLEKIDTDLGKALVKVYQANIQPMPEEKRNVIKSLRENYAGLLYAAKGIGPDVMGKEIADVGYKVGKNTQQLKNVIDQGQIDPATTPILKEIGKELKEVAEHLQHGQDEVKDTPIEAYYHNEVVGLIDYFLTMAGVSDTLQLYLDIKFDPLRSQQKNIAASADQIELIKQLQNAYKQIRAMVPAN